MFRATAPIRARIKSLAQIDIPDADPRRWCGTSRWSRTGCWRRQTVRGKRIHDACRAHQSEPVARHRTARAWRCCVSAACRRSRRQPNRTRVSGQVDAMEVQVASDVGGRVIEMPVAEGDRVAGRRHRPAGHARRRARARSARRPSARRRMHSCGCCRPAHAPRMSARPKRRPPLLPERLRRRRPSWPPPRPTCSDSKAAAEQLGVAEAARRCGGATRRGDRPPRVQREAVRPPRARRVARLRAGARREEVEAARARVAAADAQIASLEKITRRCHRARPDRRHPQRAAARSRRDGCATRPDRRRDGSRPRMGRSLRRRAARASNQARAVSHRFHRCRRSVLPGKVSFIASKAEFTPRNVQTAEDRSKLVYRVKVSVDNRQGVLKQGMPVEVEIAAAVMSAVASRPRHEEIRRCRRRPRSVDVGGTRADVRPHRA